MKTKRQNDDILNNGWIRRREAQAQANILFVQEPHSKDFRLCMNFRNLYAIITKTNTLFLS